MSCSACVYCIVARSGMVGLSTGVALPGGARGVPAVFVAAAAAVAAVPAAAGEAVPAGARAAVFAEAGAAATASTGPGARAAFSGALWQAASSASAPMLTNRFDQLLTDFHLAVTAWIELRQRGVALLYPFIVGAVLGSRCVDFVQFDRLLLEREGLLLEQYVVLVQFVFG